MDKEGGIGSFSVCYKEKFAAGENKAGVISWNDIKTIKNTIRKIKGNNRWCILIVHAGEEFSDIPMPNVRRRYLKYLKLGADIIIAHHPHVPQNYEKVGEKIIFYSLGNFIFDTDYQRLQPHTDSGILIKLNFSGDSFDWESKAFKIERQEKRIVPSEAPIIFREINASEYSKLAPLAAHRFYERNKVAKTFLMPKMKNYPALKWVQWYIKHKGLSMAFALYFAKWRYSPKKYKKLNPELLAYLEEKK